MSSPITLHPTPSAGFDEPFEMLAACHERVERMLGLLQRLAEHLVDKGADEPARQAARDVMRYFDIAGPAHHEDEERHVFPALLSVGDVGLSAVVERLHAEHLQMVTAWATLRQELARIADAGDATATHWQAFAALYRTHIETEEGVAYPAALRALSSDARAAMGREMAQRRGVR
jgi:hemerythrin-like domain-containing protein